MTYVSLATYVYIVAWIIPERFVIVYGVFNAFFYYV